MIPKSDHYILIDRERNTVVARGSKKEMHKLRKMQPPSYYSVGLDHTKKVGDKWKEETK